MQCEDCLRRYPYVNLPTCRICGASICADCWVDGTFREDDGRESCVCVTCDDDADFYEGDEEPEDDYDDEVTDVDFG